ncbi:MAG: hypothetical protein SCI25_15560 [Desulfuromonadales bacterium]|nr:hypothetical protein [Desulfuromonadales bacterium]MDW7758929.1 hypothetical protein [Desulfuromonadales bacterium]
MSRKPVDQRNPLASREALWQAIRKLRTFSPKEIRWETTCSASQVDDYLKALVAGGYVARIEGERGRYELVKDPGTVAPRLRKDGTQVTMGRGRLQMWRAMRVLRRFTPVDLAANASLEEHVVAVSEAADYCQHLAKAGYLVRRANQYVFPQDRYTGPQPPQIQRVKQVYDPNLRQVVWSQGGDHDQF